MDQLAAFVGTAIFLSQITTSGHSITIVSNSAAYQSVEKTREEINPLCGNPHGANGAGEGSSERTCYFPHICNHHL